MRQITIDRLDVKNFKGLEQFQTDLAGKNATIYGDNATGKTSVYDSFLWSLFGKDSLNNANFEIKPIHKNGVEVAVEAVLAENGDRLALKKVYAEKWVKRRGAPKAEFTGHSVDHWVNGVPSKKKEFDATIAGVCPEDVFRLLTNARQFNEVLHWLERRKKLLEISGDITDTDVIASDKTLAKLPAILGKLSLDDYRKIIKARLPEINREIQKIPVRIDEITASRVEPENSVEALQASLKDLQAHRQGLSNQLSQIESGGEIGALQGKITEVNTRILTEKNRVGEINRKIREAAIDKHGELMRAANKAEDDLLKAQSAVRSLSGEIKAGMDRATALEAQVVSLRAEWDKVDKTLVFEFTQESICPTCKQCLPESQLEDARKTAQEAHNAAKAQMLGEITAKGKAAKAQAEESRVEVELLQERLSVVEADLTAMIEAKAEATAAVKAYNVDAVVLEEPNIAALEQEKAELISQINALRAGAADGAEAVRARLVEVDAGMDACNKGLLSHEANKRIGVRVEELKKQERALAAEYEKLEGELHLTEQFVRAKVALLEDKINAKFKLAKWKLFNELINGGLEETCIMTVDGVPYGSLNNAMRINAGIECCNVLAEHYGIALPVFCDNAEAVTDLLPSVGQQIRLVVSEKDKTLRVE